MSSLQHAGRPREADIPASPLSAPSVSSWVYSKPAVCPCVSDELPSYLKGPRSPGRSPTISRLAHSASRLHHLTPVSVITAHYYRRSEQPVRVSIWYCTVGFGQIASSLLSFGLGKIANPSIESWRILFITVGLITVLTAPLVYWFLPPNIQGAKFFTEDDKAMALERVRANQTGTSATTVFKWSHIVETLWDPKTYLFGGLSLCVNFGATVATAVRRVLRIKPSADTAVRSDSHPRLRLHQGGKCGDRDPSTELTGRKRHCSTRHLAPSRLLPSSSGPTSPRASSRRAWSSWE